MGDRVLHGSGDADEILERETEGHSVAPTSELLGALSCEGSPGAQQ